MQSLFRAASFAAVSFCAVATVAAEPSFAVIGSAPAPTPAAATAAPALTVEPQGLLDDDAALASPDPASAATVTKPTPAERHASLAALVASRPLPETLTREQECLAGAVYFESKGESLEGQLAVAEVIVNRAASGRFPSSICGVVYQPSQFSFVRGRAMPPIRRGSQDWREAVAIADIALAEQWQSRVDGALFFHARHVSPNWRKTRMAQLGNHVFYR